MGLLDNLPPPSPLAPSSAAPGSTTAALAPQAAQEAPRPVPNDADEYSQRVVDAMVVMRLDASAVSVGLLHQLEDHARKYAASTYERDKAHHAEAAVRIIAAMDALAEGDQVAALDALTKRVADLESQLKKKPGTKPDKAKTAK